MPVASTFMPTMTDVALLNVTVDAPLLQFWPVLVITAVPETVGRETLNFVPLIISDTRELAVIFEPVTLRPLFREAVDVQVMTSSPA
jgi:hypothetical protein